MVARVAPVSRPTRRCTRRRFAPQVTAKPLGMITPMFSDKPRKKIRYGTKLAVSFAPADVEFIPSATDRRVGGD